MSNGNLNFSMSNDQEDNLLAEQDFTYQFDFNTQDVWDLLGVESVSDRQVFLENMSLAEEPLSLDGQIGGFLPAPRIQESYNKKWDATKKTLTFNLSNHEFRNFFEANEIIDSLFEQIYSNYIQPISSNNIIQYIIQHDSFDIPITSGYIMRDQITAKMIQSHFENVFQSRKKQDACNFQESHSLIITLNIMPKRQIRGGSKRLCKEKRGIKTMRDLIENSRYIHVINFDNFCLVRAILIAQAFIEKEKNAWTWLRPSNKNLNLKVKYIVEQLHLPDEHLNLDHVKKIDDFLKDYKITIYDSISNGSSVLYPRESNVKDKRTKFINICFEENHFNVITRMTAYLGCSYYCQYCRVKYSNRGDHFCENICESCKRYSYVCLNTDLDKCNDCNIASRNQTCKNLHDSGTCYKQNICNKCNHLFSRGKSHVCENQKWCPNCKAPVEFDHKCFIKKNISKKSESKFGGFIWFDIECFVNDQNYHEANLIMAKRRCNNCMILKANFCEICDQKLKFDNIQDFVLWCLNDFNQFFTLISHNGKSYDNYFVMRFLQKNKTIRDSNIEALVNGLRILTFRFRTLTFKDSSLFIPGALESFPKTYGLTQLKKGYFAHEFNKPENFDYIGKYPEKHLFRSEYFSQEKKKDFDLWYESLKDQEFNFKRELEDYCWSDVELLAAGCIRFSEISQESSKLNEKDCGLNPFKENLTISSFCNTLYRRNFMPKDSIPWIPANGYSHKEKTSKKADQWLKYISQSEGIFIRHSKNYGEKKLGPYKVDGYCKEKKRIYEFHGK